MAGDSPDPVGGRWVQPPRHGTDGEAAQRHEAAEPHAADETPPPFAWVEAALHPATTPAPVHAAVVPAERGPSQRQGPAVDMGGAAALAITLGLVAMMLGSFLTGISSQMFLGTTVGTEVGRSFRLRLLAVFAGASFEPAVALVLAVLLAAIVPADRHSPVRRPALYIASGLGVFIGCAAALRVVALLSFLGSAAALAVGSTISAVAAIPVAAAASAWAVSLLSRDPTAPNSLH